MKLRLQLTETIPEDIEEGILYVSLTYWTTAHKCGCGCGQKVVLRLSPKHWAITLNGESVSMYPSVGNWQLPCRSHYWIEDGRILHARRWSENEIRLNRAMTKGTQTPFQTPHSRLYKSPQPKDSSTIPTRRAAPGMGNGAERYPYDPPGSTGASTGRDWNDAKPDSIRWWIRLTHAINRNWRKVIDRIGGTSAS